MKITLDFGKGTRAAEYEVEETVLDTYISDYITAFAEKGSYYRIGKSSGNVIFEARMYGEISEFCKTLPSSKVIEESIIMLNQNLPQPSLTYSAWISLDDYVFDNFEDRIMMDIQNKYGAKVVPQLNVKTYVCNDKEVIFFIFNNASRGMSLYAVPVGLAKELNLADYHGEEISRCEKFLDIIDSYIVDNIGSYNND